MFLNSPARQNWGWQGPAAKSPVENSPKIVSSWCLWCSHRRGRAVPLLGSHFNSSSHSWQCQFVPEGVQGVLPTWGAGELCVSPLSWKSVCQVTDGSEQCLWPRGLLERLDLCIPGSSSTAQPGLCPARGQGLQSELVKLSRAARWQWLCSDSAASGNASLARAACFLPALSHLGGFWGGKLLVWVFVGADHPLQGQRSRALPEAQELGRVWS